MSKKISWIILIATALISNSCKQSSKNNFEVKIFYTHAYKLMANGSSPRSTVKVYLQEVPYGRDQTPITLDSTKISGDNGTITLSGNGKSQGIYEVVFGENIVEVPLINDSKDIKLNIDLAKRDDFYQVD